MQIRTRIAPSPTGEPHVGTLFIALFNFIFAKHFKGKFILRIEDTDLKRSKKIFEENIIKALLWGKTPWDEGPDIGGDFGPYRQSDRSEIYKKYIQKLLDEKKAYKCFATEEELGQMREVAKKLGKKTSYDRRYRNLSDEEIKEREEKNMPFVIRLKVPLSGKIEFEDKIKGKIEIPCEEIDDQILMKSDGMPTYHFANVVDDHLMKISHVIRGDEWLSSTCKHIILYNSFGWSPPVFMHMPLLIGKDKKKLSKRRDPTSIFYFKDLGYLPDALINFLSLMGYHMQEGKEIYSLNELIEKFDPKKIGKSPAFFDMQKLDWINQQYIINKVDETTFLSILKELYLNDNFIKKIIPLAHSRIKNFGSFFDLCDFLFKNDISYSQELLTPKNIDKETSKSIMQGILFLLKEDFSSKNIENISHKAATFFNVNHKKIIMPILFGAIMGRRFGPSLFESCDILGKEKIRVRILKAIEFLGGISKKNSEDLKEKILKTD